jgi:hypothetical protein
MNFIRLKWSFVIRNFALQVLKLGTVTFETLYFYAQNFIITKIGSKHIQYGSTFIDLVVMNVMVQTELKIDG